MLHAGWWIALQGKQSVVQFLVNGRSDLLVDSLSTPHVKRIYNKPVNYDSLRLRLHNAACAQPTPSGVPGRILVAAA